jgi:hypothetical protein
MLRLLGTFSLSSDGIDVRLLRSLSYGLGAFSSSNYGRHGRYVGLMKPLSFYFTHVFLLK